MKNYELARNISLVVASSSLLASCAVRESDALFNESSTATNLIVENSFEASTTMLDPVVVNTLGTVATDSVSSVGVSEVPPSEMSVTTAPATAEGVAVVNEPADVNVRAERVEPIEVLDCSDNPIIVFGNSTDSVTGVNIADMSNAWAAKLQTVMQSDARFSGINIVKSC